MKLIIAIAAAIALGIATLAAPTPVTVEAAACPEITRITTFDYTTTPTGLNVHQYSIIGASGSLAGQTILWERSTDAGATWTTVQQSTSTRYRDGLFADADTRYRVSLVGPTCSPDGTPREFDPPAGGPVMRFLFF